MTGRRAARPEGRSGRRRLERLAALGFAGLLAALMAVLWAAFGLIAVDAAWDVLGVVRD